MNIESIMVVGNRDICYVLIYIFFAVPKNIENMIVIWTVRGYFRHTDKRYFSKRRWKLYNLMAAVGRRKE